MDLKLNIYSDRLCRKVEKTVTAPDFELSTAICEDVLAVINVDAWDGGLTALSDEAMAKLAIPIIKNGFPFFVELLAEIFEITEDEAKRTSVKEIAKILVHIVKYSFSELNSSLGQSNSKN